ncbi:uncharacterized protein VTP21DRAFT_5945 [Calcarisporiella thermophila]|uniref:uncharacterized protein n=1 Tax=Calcarisporiella thermophila TaxID=911321 RepID=UPI003742DD67
MGQSQTAVFCRVSKPLELIFSFSRPRGGLLHKNTSRSQPLGLLRHQGWNRRVVCWLSGGRVRDGADALSSGLFAALYSSGLYMVAPTELCARECNSTRLRLGFQKVLGKKARLHEKTIPPKLERQKENLNTKLKPQLGEE